ncbi:conserved hypothetical protein [Candidatus Terasakiella magnetica]|uniref:Methionyl-tRNA formyltransferase n=1 Tax=Candidatus Terasakiella magnetica TaxID=1867952 RepID=A0A1C3RG31_9PROT|nr:methionyl-tRNA formyltransferase [Candidatus Terasakiella magnetica]SCA56240.1 conserved hypothetical protein [Candidatus Terasakiella magnetica]
MKFVALGRTHLLFDAIKLAVQNGYECCAIITNEAAPEYKVGVEDFKHLAEEIGASFFNVSNLNSELLRQEIAKSGAQVGISVNWPVLIKKDFRSLLPYGVLNAHAGDVPRYKGNACPNWALLNGEEEVCLSLMQMDDGLDSGPVFKKIYLPIDEGTYISKIYDDLEKHTPLLFLDALHSISEGNFSTEPQPIDPDTFLRVYPRRPEDGKIDWNTSFIQVDRLIRASAEPFAGAFSFLDDGRKITIWRARKEEHVGSFLAVPGQVAGINRKSGEIRVLCRDGVICIEEVQLEDEEKRCLPSDVIRSMRERLH